MPDGDFQSQLMGYDRASTLFSPEGRIFQVEYAEKTVRLGASSIGFVCKDGVVIVADKRVVEKLLVAGSIYKIYEIDDHIIASAAGILSDARVLIERAQLYAQQHRITFNDDVEIESVVRDICNIKQAFTQYGGARPFGVQIMFAGINVDSSKKLYVTDVTGNYNAYHAIAIGEHDEKIKEILHKEYQENMSINDAIKLGLKIFKKLLSKDFNFERIDVVYVKEKERKPVRLSPEEIKKVEK
ncbi:MAG: archaeal proteasome endopeptidase complex subunit alpha [Candidatus Pacearchaeota archaeon]